MRALVTGACGFVGGYLVRELVDAGYEVVATDVLERPPSCAGERAALVPAETAYRRCDIADGGAVRELVSEARPDVIFHLAAQSSAAESFDEPRRTLETNVFGALSVLEAVRRGGLGSPGAKTPSTRARVLCVGSAEEYGARSAREMPLREESPVSPASPYAVSKAAQTMLAVQYARSFALEVVVARSFSHTGPGQTTRFVLPSFARQCAEIKTGKQAPVVKVGRLDVVRDYLDVRDVVRAYRLLAERGTAGALYNVCSGRGLSLKDALAFFIGASEARVTVEEDPERLRPSDIPVLVGDNAKLRGECGWEARFSTETMLRDLFDYWERISRGA